jgi:hypothetical protein
VAGATLVVDNDGFATQGDCDAPSPDFPTPYTTITAAITAALPGDTVVVCPGNGPYDEQPVINKPLTTRGRGNATVRPSPMLENSTSLASGAQIAAGVLVMDTTNVTIESIAVDGTDNGLTECDDNPVGIFYRNASGTIQDVAVRHMRLGPGPVGCQGGLGIFVQSGDGGTAEVLVRRTSVHGYHKNGITANEAGTRLIARQNRVTGLGPIPDVAQNGIQLGFGAAGEIRDNVVANHVYSPCVIPDETCAAASSGVLIFEAAAAVAARNNTVVHSQVGIYADTDDGTIQGNDVTQTLVFDGIAVVGDNNLVRANDVSHSEESGITIDGTGNTVRNNRINEAPIGIWDFIGANTIPTTGGQRNTFFNVGVPVHIGATPPTISSLLRELTLVREAVAPSVRRSRPSPVR